VSRTIGIAGPVSIDPFRHLLGRGEQVPETYSFPLIGVLVRELHARGNHLVVFAGSLSVSSPTRFEGDRISLIVCPLRRKRAAYDWWAAERRDLVEAMRASRCDIIHAHWTYEFAAAALDSGIPSLITAHDSPLVILKQFIATRFAPFWTFRSLFGAAVIRRARAMTTVSPYCRAHIVKTLHPRASISVIPNGVEPAVCEFGQVRIAKGEPAGPPVIASVMDGFSKRKNAGSALKAFAMFRKSEREARYVIFGTSYGEGEEAHRWAVSNNLADGVEFRGRTPQATMFPELLSQAHVFLHPSVEESFGMAPLEAMALGIPVIGGLHSGGVPYVLGDSGLVVNVRRPVAIAEALQLLWSEPSRRERMAIAGLSRAKSVFSLEKMVTDYEMEYAKILSL